jgi:hypothetical protein
MSKMDTPYISPRSTKHSCAGPGLHSGWDDGADYTIVVDTDSRMLELGLTPPIHQVCDSCWRPAAMESFGWNEGSEGALCCFCGALTTSGRQVAYWALDVICENKH